MKNTFGNALGLTIFGESHGAAVGAVLDGLAAGLPVDEAYIAERMDRRRARGDGLSTARTEADAVEEVKLRSRQYAKRQLTWLRRNEAIHWVLWDKVPDFPSGLQNATTFLTSSGVC